MNVILTINLHCFLVTFYREFKIFSVWNVMGSDRSDFYCVVAYYSKSYHMSCAVGSIHIFRKPGLDEGK